MREFIPKRTVHQRIKGKWVTFRKGELCTVSDEELSNVKSKTELVLEVGEVNYDEVHPNYSSSEDVSAEKVLDEELEKKEVVEDYESLKSLTVKELKRKCKEMGLRGYSKLNEDGLINLVLRGGGTIQKE